MHFALIFGLPVVKLAQQLFSLPGKLRQRDPRDGPLATRLGATGSASVLPARRLRLSA